MLKVAGSILGGGSTDFYYAPRRCDRSIGSTVSDAIVRRELWSTPTMSSQLGYFSRLLQVVDIIDPTFCDGIFSTGRLLSIEDILTLAVDNDFALLVNLHVRLIIILFY